jgi:hypothetical protein
MAIAEKVRALGLAECDFLSVIKKMIKRPEKIKRAIMALAIVDSNMD